MEFNKEHKVIINTLNQVEAKAFIKFLESEIIRHRDDINQAKAQIGYVKKEILDEGIETFNTLEKLIKDLHNE